MIPGNTRHWGAIKSRILQRLTQDEGKYVHTRDLIEHVWTMRDLEEPLQAEQSVSRNVRGLRKMGFAIDAKRGAGSPGYRLLPVGALLASEAAE